MKKGIMPPSLFGVIAEPVAPAVGGHDVGLAVYLVVQRGCRG
jgi:hypothetical protein